jgi:hypothetical protein
MIMSNIIVIVFVRMSVNDVNVVSVDDEVGDGDVISVD